MEAMIRLAQPDDAGSIVMVIRASLGDEVSIERIHSILQSGQHTTLVALVSEKIVGFIDGFITTSEAGMPRTELDLLGVLPEVQGRGVGSKLVDEFVRLYPSIDHDLQIRTLVAHQNVSMQHVMARTGFSCDGSVYGLFIRDVDTALNNNDVSDGHLILVETLTYSGVWIEERFTSDAIGSANTLGLANKREIIGSLISLGDLDQQELAITNGFMQIGTFQWWNRLQ